MLYVIRIPQCDDGGDQDWCVQFRAPVDGQDHDIMVTDLSERNAAEFMLRSVGPLSGRVTFCSKCPTGEPACVHDEEINQRGWQWSDISHVRAMQVQEIPA